MLQTADDVGREISRRLEPTRKSALGQFMTPPSIARFMASLFPPSDLKTCRLLDAGAGVGALSCAFLDRWREGGFTFRSVDVTACEIDAELREHLARHLAAYPGVRSEVLADDYIEHATAQGLRDRGYTHAILNPPYKKINSASAHRLALRNVGVETVNLYSAFLALAVGEAAQGGQIVAIIPRSFCNGPYYRPFRDFILARAAIRRMHLFESRSTAFKDDDVLQENIILHLERSGTQGAVTVSTSTDDSFSDLALHDHPFDRIVLPSDPERFIHVPTSTDRSAIELSPAIRSKLIDLGVKVSTGPVVDFRVRAHLRDMPEPGSVPLLYPSHLTGQTCVWPIAGMKKPNAIMRHAETDKWLYPTGFYCVVRRFSSKEERHRVMASVVEPGDFGDAPALGFENHLNVYHDGKRGLPETLARGLAVFLNSSAVDEDFRRFNGHTQVNATDLKLMKYPSRDTLSKLGVWAKRIGSPTQAQIDAKMDELLS